MKKGINISLFALSVATVSITGWNIARAQKSKPTRPVLEQPGSPVSVADPSPSGTRGRELQRRMDASTQLTHLGQVNLAQSNFTAAEGFFRQALNLYPRNAGAAAGLARVLERQGNLAGALAGYRQAFSDSPNHSFYSTFPRDVEAVTRYGLLAEQAGQWREAVQAYEIARERLNPKPMLLLDVEFDPKTPQPAQLRAMLHVVRGLTLDEQGKHEDALSAYTEATRLQPNQPLAQFYLGRGLQKAGRAAEARAAFQKAAQYGHGAVQAEAQKALR